MFVPEVYLYTKVLNNIRVWGIGGRVVVAKSPYHK
jgi:hypothetical protein